MIMKFSKHTELVQHFETWNMMWITLPYNFLIRRQLGCPSALLANWQQFEIPSWNLEVSHPPLPNYEQNKASRRMDQFAWFLSAIEKICVLENSFSFPSPAFVAFWSGSLEWKRTTYKLGRVVPDPSVRCLNCALHMTSDIPKIWRCHQRRIRPSLLPLKLVRFPLNYSFLLKCDILLSLFSF